jgi:hypothetical protein
MVCCDAAAYVEIIPTHIGPAHNIAPWSHYQFRGQHEEAVNDHRNDLYPVTNVNLQVELRYGAFPSQ